LAAVVVTGVLGWLASLAMGAIANRAATLFSTVQHDIAPQWRAKGRVCAVRPSEFALHVVLKCRYFELFGERQRALCFVPCLCIDVELRWRLERSLAVGDAVALGGSIEPRMLRTHPLAPHSWDFIVTKAAKRSNVVPAPVRSVSTVGRHRYAAR